MLKVGRKYDSITIEADAMHLMTDVWTSAGVLGGLLVILFFPAWHILDPLIAIAVGLALLGLIAWRVAGSPVAVRTVTIDTPAGASDTAVLNASGYVVARRMATVSSKLTGRITEVLFEEGASVAQGQLLARLDPSTARAELGVADSGLTAARRNLGEIEVRVADARRALARNRSLFERKLVAQSVLDTSQAEVSFQSTRTSQ